MKAFKRTLVTVVFCLLMMAFPIIANAAGGISQKSVTLKIAQQKKLKVNGEKGKVKWKTGDPSIAVVSSKGVVTAVRCGKTTITAKVGSKKYTCKVTVKLNQTMMRNDAKLRKAGNLQFKIIQLEYNGDGSLSALLMIRNSNSSPVNFRKFHFDLWINKQYIAKVRYTYQSTCSLRANSDIPCEITIPAENVKKVVDLTTVKEKQIDAKLAFKM